MLRYLKHIVFSLFTIAFILAIYSLLSQSVDVTTIWLSILLNAFFFLSISAFGYLFISFHILAGSSWHLPFQSILHAMDRFLPIASSLFLILLLGINNIYPWIQDPSLIEGKEWYINKHFFIIRTILFVTIWILLSYLLSKKIKKGKSPILGATLITVFFSVSFLVFVQDWLLTLCCSWNSTLFSWFILIGVLSIGMASTIVIFYLKFGYIQLKNKKSLLIDGARYLFTFSCVWMYFWYSQFMLIWYSNITHETYYFANQYFNYKFLFILVLVLNFGIPLIILISKAQKKNPIFVLIASVSVLIGQWLNLYLAIFPVLGYAGNIAFPFAVLFFIAAIFLIVTLDVKIRFFKRFLPVVVIPLVLYSCGKPKDHPGYNYYPEMTYSRPYQAYSGNPNFNDSLTMRVPVEGTVPKEMIPFRYAKDIEERTKAGVNVINPLVVNQQVLNDGKFLYESFCVQCHGEKGDGLGKLYTDKFYTYKPGVLISDKIRNAPDGEVYHAISSGFNLMGAHKSILLPEERWEIVSYIRTLSISTSQ